MDASNFFKTPEWYPALANKTFITTFVKLTPEAIQALADGITESDDPESPVNTTIKDLKAAMADIRGYSFVFTDCCAPTDTERFLNKNGSVFSAKSAWRILASSEKVRESAKKGEVEHICVRPFRHVNKTREFRLFVHDGRLAAMSQYHLIRHFRRLEKIKDQYLLQAELFVHDIIWKLPVKDLVIDIYFTSDDKIMVFDLNKWGEPTNPLMLNTWNRDWSQSAGIVLMPPPISISGDVNISF